MVLKLCQRCGIYQRKLDPSSFNITQDYQTSGKRIIHIHYAPTEQVIDNTVLHLTRKNLPRDTVRTNTHSGLFERVLNYHPAIHYRKLCLSIVTDRFLSHYSAK